MRVVHDIDDEMQCCSAMNGSLVSVSLVNEEEQIYIEGDPKYVLPALKLAVEHLESILEVAGHGRSRSPALRARRGK